MIRKRFYLALLWLPASAAAVATPRGALAQQSDALVVQASATSVCAGQSVTLTAKKGKDPAAVTWTLTPVIAGSFSPDGGAAAASVVLKTTSDDGGAALFGTVTVKAALAAGGGRDAQTATALIRLVGSCTGPTGGDLVRATLGFEQIGASGVDGSQKYAFDFFVSRPFPFLEGDTVLGPPFRWWGDVGIASYPQQISSDVASFATGFATSVGQLKVAQLVQTADFTTGIEWRVWTNDQPLRGFGESTAERFSLVAYGAYGAVGPFPLATDPPPVFEVPDSSSPQGRAFAAATGDSVKSKYVAFRVRAPDRFSETLSAGLRLYTFYTDPSGRPLATPPAVVSIGWGRNDLVVTGPGRRAWHVSAQYPLAFGDRADPNTLIVYLIGDAWLSNGQAKLSAPAYQLKPATVDGTTGGAAVSASDPNVTILTVDPQPRDTYRLGLSVDLLKIWSHVVGNK